MSSIEDRVVNLKFNNAAFEAKIKDTLKSLELLKKSLNFEGAKKSLADFDKAAGKLGAKVDTSKLQASIKDLSKASTDLQKQAKFDQIAKELNKLSSQTAKPKLDASGVTTGASRVNESVKTMASNISTSLRNINVGDIASKINNSIRGISWAGITNGFQNVGTQIGTMATTLGTSIRNIEPKSFSLQPIIAGVQGFMTYLGNQNLQKHMQGVADSVKNVSGSIGNLNRQSFTMSNVVSGTRNAVSSLGSLKAAGDGVKLDGLGKGADEASAKFSAMSVVGIAAIAAIGAKAAIVGAGIAKNMLIDTPMSGYREYETNLNSIQTILANTQSKGSTLEDVNVALEQLNAYSDQTIYNFAEMAKAIGTFTTAGVDLDTSVTSIKGFSNVAAMSGANAQQAAGAQEQLSRALSSGKVALQDWISIETAGMASESFRESLMETARVNGVAIDDMVAASGGFRNTLAEGWLTTDIMTETLAKFTGDLTDAELDQMGYNQQQIMDIQKMASTAKSAATEVKTATQLVGTLQETAGSGWAMTSKIVVGDFMEAKALWTEVNGLIGGYIGRAADQRNAMLSDWKALGGRDMLLGALTKAFENLIAIIKPIGEAFREVFPPMTGQRLYELTEGFHRLVYALEPSKGVISLIKGSFKLFFAILKIGVTIIGGALTVIGAFFKAIFTGGESVGATTEQFGAFITRIADVIANSTLIQRMFEQLAKFATLLGEGIRFLVGKIVELGIGFVTFVQNSTLLQTIFQNIREFFESVPDRITTFISALGDFGKTVLAFFSGAAAGVMGFAEGGWETATTRIRERLESLGRWGDRIKSMFESVKQMALNFWMAIEPIRNQFTEMFGDIGRQFSDVLKDVNFNDILDVVNTVLLGGLVLMFKNFFKKGLGIGEGARDGILDQLGESLGGLKDALAGLTGTLEAMQKALLADALLKIAIAIGILAASIVVLSLIDSADLTKATVAMGALFYMLSGAMASLTAMTLGPGFIKLPMIAAAMVLLATAILILAAAVKTLSELSWMELIKGLAGVSVLLTGITMAANAMGPNAANLIATGIGLMAVAVAVKILASAVKNLAELDFADMMQGLIGVGALLVGLAIFTKLAVVNKGAMAQAAGLILLGVALKVMASAVGDFADMPIEKMTQGMIALGAVMGMMAAFTVIAQGPAMIKAAAAMVVVGGALHVMASAVGQFADMSWEELAKGLIGMAASLGAVALALVAIPPTALASSASLVIAAGALKIMAHVMQEMGGMSWEEIGKSVVVLAASLVLIAGGLYLMTAALPGAAALIVAAGALAILAPVLVTLSALTWDELLHGLAALGGVFLVIGVAAAVLTPVIPIIVLLGVSIGLLGAGLLGVGLGMLAFTTALIALSATAAITVPAIVLVITALVQLLPFIAEQLGLAVIRFAEVLSGAGPVFVAAATTLIMSLLLAIQILVPEILVTVGMLITAILDLLVQSVPEIAQKGTEMILGLLRGINENIYQIIEELNRMLVLIIEALAAGLPELIAAGSDYIIALIEGIGNESAALMEAGAQLVIDLVNNLATTIDNKSGEMQAAGANLGVAIINGMSGGLLNNVGTVISAASEVAASALQSAKEFLGIASPSKEFRKIGRWTSEGMAIGIDDNAGMAASSAEGMAVGALNKVKSTFARIGDAVGGEMQMQPTIRPILDLSDVQSNATRLNGMFGAPSLAVDGTYDKAAMLSNASLEQQEARATSNDPTSVAAGNTTVFNQYNTSPVAISPAEHYRQTKNLISATKGELTNA